MSDSFISSIPLQNFAQHLLPRLPVKTLGNIAQAVICGSTIGHCALVAKDMFQGVHELDFAKHANEAIEETIEYSEEAWNKELPTVWKHISLNFPYALGIVSSLFSSRKYQLILTPVFFVQKNILNVCQALAVASAVRQIWQKKSSGYIIVACLAAAWTARNNWVAQRYGDACDETFGFISNSYRIYSGDWSERILATIRIADQTLQLFWPHIDAQDHQKALSQDINPDHLLPPDVNYIEPIKPEEFALVSEWFQEWKANQKIVPDRKISQEEAQRPENPSDPLLLWNLAWQDKQWYSRYSNQNEGELIAHVQQGLEFFVKRIQNSPATSPDRKRAAHCINFMKNDAHKMEKIFLFGLGEHDCAEGRSSESKGVFALCGGNIPPLSEGSKAAILGVLHSEREQLFNNFMTRTYNQFSLRSILPQRFAGEEGKPSFWRDLSLLKFFFGDHDGPHALNVFKDQTGHPFFLHDTEEARESLPVEHRTGPVWRAIWNAIFHARGLNAGQWLAVNYSRNVIIQRVADLVRAQFNEADQDKRNLWLAWLKETHPNQDNWYAFCEKDEAGDDTDILAIQHARFLAERELIEAGILNRI